MINANHPCEDRHAVEELPNGLLAAAVLDGHGGWEVADWLSRKLLPSLNRRLKEEEPGQAGRSVLEALEATFADCEKALLKQVEASESTSGLVRALRIGACALCAVIGPSHLAIANAGDCQALLVRDGQPVQLSVIHNADQPEEQRRLRDAHPDERDVFICRGGAVQASLGDGLRGFAQRAFNGQAAEVRLSACYVKGRLQPTRTFGDFYLKEARYAGLGLIHPPWSPPYITAAPEIAVLAREEKDQVLILASDGLWDYLTGVDVARLAVDVLKTGQEEVAQVLASTLVGEALRTAAREHRVNEDVILRVPPGPRRRRLHDDITVVVVLL